MMGDKFYHFETIYCLLMYFPIAALAFDILTMLIKEIRLRRRSMSRIPGKRGEADFESINKILLNDLKNYMTYLFGALAPKPGMNMKYFFKDERHDTVETIEYTFKEESDAYLEVSTWNSSKVFSRFSLDNIKLIISAMLLDKPLIFFSSDLKVLTSTLNTFLGLLSPFKYVFEIVSLIPEQRMGLCCSPRPILICINRPEELYLSGELEECGDKIMVFIDSKIIYLNEEDPDLKNFPVLDFLTEDLEKNYKFLNPQDSGFEIKRRKEQLDAAFLVNPPQPYLRVKRTEPKNHEKSAKKKEIIMGIFKHFREYLQMNVSNFMPHFSSYNSLQTSAEEIEQWINMWVKSKPIREFFYAFRHTQGFLSYLEDLK